ncbi:hypothetical protein LMIY3S_02826 [Labrys miyagiensis]
MRHLFIAGLTAVLGAAAIPAARANGLSPDATASVQLIQNVDAGCARGYYRSNGRCVPNSRGYVGPRYEREYYDSPRYYREAPSYYYDHPRYVPAPRYEVEPDYY